MWNPFKRHKKEPEKQPQSELNAYLLQFLKKRTLLILFITALGSALTAFGTYVCRPEYRATTKILVQSGTDQQILLFDDLHRPVLRGMTIIPANNIIEMATSEIHARSIVNKYKLAEELRRRIEAPDGFREDFWVWVDKLKQWAKKIIKVPYVWYKEWSTGEKVVSKPRNYYNKALSMFMKDMTDIDLVAESDVIKLSVWWTKPEEAEAIAKELTHLVVAQFVKLQQDAAAHGYELCSEELTRAKGARNAVREELEAFRRKWNIGDLARQREAKLTQLHETEKSLLSIDAELAGLEAELAEEERQLQGKKKMLTSPQSFEGLQASMIQTQVKLSALKAKKEKYEAARAKVETEVKVLNENELDLHALMREVELKEKLVLQLGQKRDELAVQRVSDLGGFNLKIIDEPDLPERARAAWPDWMLNMLIGIPASIILGIGIALLLHLWSDPFWVRSNPPAAV